MLLNASGCYTTLKEIKELDEENDCAAIVSKSATLLPKKGHDRPRLFIDKNVINNIGLENEGLSFYNQIKTNKLFIQSLYATDMNEIEKLLTDTVSDCIEFNLSCPNVNQVNFNDYLVKIAQYKNNKIIGIKMPLLFNHFDEYANLLNLHKIDFITCSNNLPNCLVIKNDRTAIYPNTGLGSMSFKHLSLANVYQFSKKFKGFIIGSGGVKTGQDVYEYILAGASLVQIGSTLLIEGVDCFKRINNELNILLANRTINDIRGTLKVASKL